MNFESQELAAAAVAADEASSRPLAPRATAGSLSRPRPVVERPSRIHRPMPGPTSEEFRRMQSSPRGGDSSLPARECVEETFAHLAQPAEGTVWESVEAAHADSRQRIAQIARTLETQIIPRLVDTLGEVPAAMPHRRHGEHGEPGLPDVPRFVQIVLGGDDAEVTAAARRWHRLSGSVTSVYLDLLAPAARELGAMWEEDRCDFASVTIALGRLQQLLRVWSPAFGREVPHAANDRRILLAQHPLEQHRFGLAMVAEFFRRSGWEVLGGPGGDGMDERALDDAIQHEWFDAVGFSIGSELRLEWLTLRVAQLRRLSRNRGVVVLVGGPLATLNPEALRRIGADAIGHDGARAPEQAEGLLAARPQLG